MAPRAPRLLAGLVAGGLLTGSLLLGAGSAVAAPADDVVEARCGETVRAEPGQKVKLIPAVGGPITKAVTETTDTLSSLIGGLLCSVQVIVVEPVVEGVGEAAPPLRPATDQLREGTGALLAPSARPQASPTSRTQAARPTTRPAAPPALTPQQTAAAAPAFAPAFGALPSSFLRSATGPAPGVAAVDPDLLLGSAFPGLRAGAPAYLGYDPASAVTTASQVQALPVDGLTGGGVGVPALLAVLVLSGVAAFTVRRIVLGRSGGARATMTPAPEGVDETPEAVHQAPTADERERDAAAEQPAVVDRTPVPA